MQLDLFIILAASAAFLSGCSQGIKELSSHKYWSNWFYNILPDSLKQWSYKPNNGCCGINETWRNKWKNGDKNQGPRFFLSSWLLVWITDQFHFFKLPENWLNASVPVFLLFSSFTVDLTLKNFIIILVTAWIIRSTGFNFTYKFLNLFIKQPKT